LVGGWLKEQTAPGVSIAAVNRNGLLWAGGFGFADVESQRPATAATRYQFASVTKVYTGLLLAQLVAEGKVDLDAPLSKYLPEFQPHYAQPGGRPVTVRDVATHSAGFTRDMTGAKASGKFHSYTLNELLAWQRDTGMTVLPGLQYKYSNFGYGVLGAALERAAGGDYRTLLRHRVLEPLGLSATGFAELRSHADLATGYRRQDDALTPGTDFVRDFGAQAPASELISTVEDVARFAHAHLCAPPTPAIPDAVRTLLFTPHFAMGDGSAMGLGWHYQWGGGIPRWAHGGSVNDYRSLIAVRPDVGVGLALAANGEADLGKLELPLLRLLATEADGREQDAVVGDYEPPNGGTKVMIRRNPDAVLTIEVRGAIRMVPWGPQTYRIIEGLNQNEWVRFVREGGQQAMVWEGRRFVRRPL
jgi:CubicO group peptidase (beta-lactamase class C family)